MDQFNGVSSDRPELGAFLATFEALSSEDKAKALQHIIRTRRGEVLTTYKTDTVCISPDVHSCHICRQLVITQKPHDDDDRHTRFESEDLVLSKETIQQGLAQKCIFIEWIFRFLVRGLHEFKSHIAKRVNPPSPLESVRDAADDLQYISTAGLLLTCDGWIDSDRSELMIWLWYEADPFLVDKLWSIAPDLHEGRPYDVFVRGYDNRVGGRFRMSAAAEDPAASEIHFRPAVQKVELEDSLELARKFLKDCQEKHELCYRKLTRLPSRVIDVGTQYPIRSVRLHWSEEDESGQYAALSYCWGGHQPLTTTSITAQDNTNGLLFSHLPRTIQDAMTVTLKLGLRYIWIDSLCILQDDPEDLSREIANMANIFQGAFVTISAASSSSVHHGFLFDSRVIPRTRVSLPYRSSTTGSGTILIEQERQAYDPAEDPINLRAWTLQEHILPRRMLVFGAKELWWTCEKAVSFDTLPTQQTEHISVIQRKSSSDRFSLDYWRTIVRDYTRRFLSYPNDKLSAIAGIADLYSQFFESRYLAGLWEFALLSELMWCSNRSDITRPLVRRAPSWSWASVDGEVHHNWCRSDISPDAPEIIECHIAPISQASPFGSIDTTRCVLRIKGKLIKAFWHESKRYVSLPLTRYTQNNPVTGVEEEVEEFSSAGKTQADAIEIIHPTDVWILPVTTHPIRGLLLAHVEGDVYRRVGLVLRLWIELFMPEDDETRVISII